MKMLTLWACIETPERPTETASPEQVLAWKQAWKSIVRPDIAPSSATAGENAVPRHTGT